MAAPGFLLLGVLRGGGGGGGVNSAEGVLKRRLFYLNVSALRTWNILP